MNIFEEAGIVLDKEGYTVLKKEFPTGGKIPRHNHPEHDVVFTVLKGKALVTIGDNEPVELEPGRILTFDGQLYISADILVQLEVQVALLTKDNK